MAAVPRRRKKAAVAPLDAERGRLLRAAGVASLVVAVTLTLLKLWAWRLTDSVALLSSMADSVLDLAASVVTFIAVQVALTPPDREHRFGHGKAEAVASLAQAVIVTGSALFVATRAIARLLEPSEIRAPEVGLAVTVVALLLTLALVLFQRYVVRRTQSLAIGADALHYQADMLVGVAVLAAIFLNYRFGWYIVDPLLALAVVALILNSVRAILGPALNVLLDHELPTGDRRKIAAIVASNARVKGVHDIRTRSAGAVQFIQLHLELDGALTLAQVHDISSDVERAVGAAFPTAQILIHVDPFGLDEPRDPF